MEMAYVDTSSEVDWYQWERVEQVATSKKGKAQKRIKTMKKICKMGNVEDVIQ